jgi:ParB family chromosome partitioning protein
MKIREVELGSLKKAKESGRDDIDLTKVVIYGVHPDDLEIQEGWNERDMTPRVRAHIDSIKESLRNGGQIPALKVRVVGPHVYVRDGHCRLTAIRELMADGLEFRRVMVEELKGSDADDIAYMRTSSRGLSQTRLEKGRSDKRLVHMGWTVKEIAERVGESVTYVEQNQMLTNADSDVQRLLRDDRISAKVALDAIRRYGHEAGAKLAARLDSEGKAKLTGASATKNPAPRVLRRVTESVGCFVASIPKEVREAVQDAPDDMAVRITAGALRALLAAHAEIAPPETASATA